MLNTSLAIKLLPLGEGDRIAIIDKVIAYLLARHPNAHVTPFETVIGGEFEEVMATLRGAILLAGEEHDNIFANIKVNYGRILTTDEKLRKYSS